MTTKHQHNFLRQGRDVMVAQDHGSEIPKLAPGIYVVKFSPDIGFYLTEQEPMSLPDKTYGSNDGRADMVVKTYLSRQHCNTGVLLTGNKGSGKTLLTKQICLLLEKIGMPILLLEEPFAGTSFSSFMNNIVQPCAVLIDEFEKKYKREEEQNALLSLLDGTGVNNKLFLLTSNSEKVSEFLISRPSRLFYHWRYGKLEEEVLIGYCKDNLKDQKHTDNLRTLWGVSSDMSFDVLQSLVEELNRYPEMDFVDLISNMNISLGDALSRRFYLKSAKLNGEEVKQYNGNSVSVNMVTFQEGIQALSASLDIPDWKTQVDLYSALGVGNCYFYNRELLHKVTEGPAEGEEALTEEQLRDKMDVEFCFNFKFRSGVDRITGDSIVFNREEAGIKIELVYDLQKEDTAMTYFRRLFK